MLSGTSFPASYNKVHLKTFSQIVQRQIEFFIFLHILTICTLILTYYKLFRSTSLNVNAKPFCLKRVEKLTGGKGVPVGDSMYICEPYRIGPFGRIPGKFCKKKQYRKPRKTIQSHSSNAAPAHSLLLLTPNKAKRFIPPLRPSFPSLYGLLCRQ